MSNVSTTEIAGICARVKLSASNEQSSHSRRFSNGYRSVQVYAQPGLFPLLESHLYIECDNETNDEWTVTVVEDEDLWNSVIEGRGLPWAPVLEYGADGYIAESEGDRLILSRKTRTAMVRSLSTRRIDIVAYDVRSAFAECYRTIRSLLTEKLKDEGYLAFHSATLERKGVGISFVGNKGAGKSTAAVNALSSRMSGLALATNDKGFVRAGTDHLQLEAWPSVINAGMESLQRVVRARDLNPAFHFENGSVAYLLLDLPLIQSISGDASIPSAPRKLRMTPEEARRYFGASFVQRATVQYVILSKLDLTLEKSTVVEVSTGQYRQAIIDENILTDWSNHPDWLHIRSSDRALAESVELPASVRILQATFGKDGPEVSRGLIAELSQGSTVNLDIVPTYHFGAYAAILDGRQLMCVRKTRGPYKNLFDLPGGKPEGGETHEEALRREIAEETGMMGGGVGQFHRFEQLVSESTSGAPIRFHHHGVIARFYPESDPSLAVESEDTAGVEWIDMDSIDSTRVSPVVLEALALYGGR